MKNGQSSNVFYTFGFLLLYVHLLLNIVYLGKFGKFFDTPDKFSIKPLGLEQFTIEMSLIEIILVGGFIVFTLIGLIVERVKLIRIKKEVEPGWKYRNRIKIWFSIIAIILVVWTTVHGYLVMKNLDEVWLIGSIIIIVFSIILMSFPRFKPGK